MNREKFMDCLAEYLGVEKYEEFKLSDSGYNYRITDTQIEVKFPSGWETSFSIFDKIKKENVIKLPWKPKRGEEYWFVDITCDKGCDYFVNDCDTIDERIFKFGEIFKTESEALKRVKELGW